MKVTKPFGKSWYKQCMTNTIETYQSKVQTYEEERMPQSDVESRANDVMRTTYKKGLISLYKRLLTLYEWL